MYYVYLLQDKKGKIYVGYSKDLKRRIGEHKSKKVYTSRRMPGPKLVYYEAYIGLEKAKERERKLKQYGSSYQGLLKRIGLKK
jgi:putative endonuclease